MTATVTPLVRAIAAHGLTSPAPEIGAVDHSVWPHLVERIAAERLCGLALGASAAGSLTLDTRQESELLRRHEEQLAVDLRVERLVLDCAQLLDSAGIQLRLLKGPALAHRVYDDPALRSFGDADILVRSSDLDRAISLLCGQGMQREHDAPSRTFDRHFAKAVCLRTLDELEVDLHRTLASGPYGVLFDNDILFECRAATVVIGDRSIACLSDEMAFLHACAHAVLGNVPPRVSAVRDIAQLLVRGIDEDAAMQCFDRFDATVLAHRGLALVEVELGLTPAGVLGDWARAFRPDARDLWRLGSYAGAGPRYRAQAAAMFWSLPGIRARARYLTALALPRREYLRRRDASYRRRFGQGTRLIAQWRPR